jgi:hypothetical protein
VNPLYPPYRKPVTTIRVRRDFNHAAACFVMINDAPAMQGQRSALLSERKSDLKTFLGRVDELIHIARRTVECLEFWNGSPLGLFQFILSFCCIGMG